MGLSPRFPEPGYSLFTSESPVYRDYARNVPKGEAPDMGDMVDAWTQHVVDMKGVDNKLKQSYLSYMDMAQNPGTRAAAPAPLPRGAIRSAQGPNNHMIYQYRGPQGYFWGDEGGQPLQQ